MLQKHLQIIYLHVFRLKYNTFSTIIPNLVKKSVIFSSCFSMNFLLNYIHYRVTHKGRYFNDDLNSLILTYFYMCNTCLDEETNTIKVKGKQMNTCCTIVSKVSSFVGRSCISSGFFPTKFLEN